MKNVSILIPEPGPLGETFFDARERAIVSASLVKRPSGGKVETVPTRRDPFFGLLLFSCPAHLASRFRKFPRRWPPEAFNGAAGPQRSVSLEKLDFTLMLLCFLNRGKSTKVTPLARSIFLSRVQPVLSGFEFAYHSGYRCWCKPEGAPRPVRSVYGAEKSASE